MKKVLLIAAAAMLLLSMTSCNKQKDGVFNPKQKISKIYRASRDVRTYSEDGGLTWSTDDPYITPMYKAEEWKWDGKLLKEITGYSSEGTISYIQTFSYDKKRLERIDYKVMENGGYTFYTTFEYDGKMLSKASMYENGVIVATSEYTHTDGKITDIVYTEYEYDKKCMTPFNVEEHLAFLRMTLPLDQISQNIIAKQESKMKTAKSHSYVTRLSLTWTDNNITRVIETDTDGDTDITSYTYDSKKNPFYGYLSNNEYEYYGEHFSENNIVSSSWGTNSSDTYTYEYDKNDYPLTCNNTWGWSSTSDTYCSRYTYTYTTTYEYVK